MKKDVWIPILLQAVVIFGGLLGYAVYSERRLTTMEMNIRRNADTLGQIASTQRELTRMQREQQQNLDRLITLEEVSRGIR